LIPANRYGASTACRASVDGALRRPIRLFGLPRRTPHSGIVCRFPARHLGGAGLLEAQLFAALQVGEQHIVDVLAEKFRAVFVVDPTVTVDSEPAEATRARVELDQGRFAFYDVLDSHEPA
jgi:hypothetical protein